MTSIKPKPSQSSFDKIKEEEEDIVMKYLTKCGLMKQLSTSEMKTFSVTDIDDSSLDLIVRLSQQSHYYCEQKGQSEMTTIVADDDDDDNDDDSTRKDMKFRIGGTENNIIRKSTTETNNPYDSSIMRNDNRKVKSFGYKQEVEEEEEVDPSVENNEKISSSMLENRDYEQLLAQFDLDSTSFYKTTVPLKKSISLPPNLPSISSSSKPLPPHVVPQGDNESDNNLHQLLSQKLKEQNDHILKCHEQIQSLARLIALDMVERRQQQQVLKDFMHRNNDNNNNMITRSNNDDNNKINNNNNNNNDATILNPFIFHPTHHEEHHQQQQQQVLPNDDNNDELPQAQMIVLSFLETFFTYLLYFPTKFINYMNSTRLLRIIYQINTQIETFRNGGELQNNRFINMTLLFKIAFFCFFLFVRFEHYDEVLQRQLESKHEIVAFQIWKNKRFILLIGSGAIVYMIQTGIWKLFYYIFVKENVIGRVWRNEDLNNNNNDDDNLVGEANSHNNNAPRRGRLDRQPVGRNDGNNDNQARDVNIMNDDANMNGDNIVENRHRLALSRTLEYIRQHTFIGGNIDRPIIRNENNGENHPQHQQLPLHVPREQILLENVIESIKDIIYLFGSFFLSLFPMWHPRAHEVDIVAPIVENQDQNISNNNNNNNNDHHIENSDGNDDIDYDNNSNIMDAQTPDEGGDED